MVESKRGAGLRRQKGLCRMIVVIQYFSSQGMLCVSPFFSQLHSNPPRLTKRPSMSGSLAPGLWRLRYQGQVVKSFNVPSSMFSAPNFYHRQHCLPIPTSPGPIWLMLKSRKGRFDRIGDSDMCPVIDWQVVIRPAVLPGPSSGTQPHPPQPNHTADKKILAYD